MGGGDKKQTSTQTTNSSTTPPSYALPYAQQGLHWANELANQPYTPFQGEQVAPLNGYQIPALQDIYNYGMADNQTVNSATNQLNDTLNGKYLDPNSNPYLAQYVQQAQGDVSRNYLNSTVPQYSAASSRAGAFGGSADTLMRTEGMRNLGDTLSKTATSMYAPAYESERNRQMQGVSQAPQTVQMPLTLKTAALGVGDIYQKQQQAVDTANYQNYQNAQQWPYMAAQAGADMFKTYGWGNQTNSNSTNSTTQSGGEASPFSQIMGGALGLGGMALAPFTGGASLLGTGASMLSNLFKGSGSSTPTYTSPDYAPGGYGYQNYG